MGPLCHAWLFFWSSLLLHKAVASSSAGDWLLILFPAWRAGLPPYPPPGLTPFPSGSRHLPASPSNTVQRSGYIYCVGYTYPTGCSGPYWGWGLQYVWWMSTTAELMTITIPRWALKMRTTALRTNNIWWTTGRRSSGMGVTCWPGSSPARRRWPKRGRDQSGWKKNLWGPLKGLDVSS